MLLSLTLHEVARFLPCGTGHGHIFLYILFSVPVPDMTSEEIKNTFNNYRIEWPVADEACGQ